MQQETSAISQPVLVFSPSEVLAQYRNSLHSTFDGTAVCVSGFYERGNGREYNGTYYDRLIDENRKDKIVVITGSSERSQLQDGVFYSFVGFLEKGAITQESMLRMHLKVQQVAGSDKTRKQFSETDYDILKARMDRGFARVDSLLNKILKQNQKADILIITGLDSVVDKDFLTALGDFSSQYNITWKKTNMSSIQQMIEIISELDKNEWTLLALIRGGGSGLHVFNDMKLCSAMLDSGIPFVSAIGHETDKPVLSRLADRSFSTPTSFGDFLAQVAENQTRESRKAEDSKLSMGLIRAELRGKEEQIEKMRQDFDRRITESQKHAKNLYLIIALVGILLILSLWVK